MNYLKIYDSIVKRAQKRKTISGYFESHHILPRCMGGNNKKSNIVRLTAKEHYISHLLLAKIHNTRGLWLAVASMRGCNGGGVRFTGSMYETAKRKISESIRGENNPNYGGLREETKQKLSIKATGRKHSQETKDAMSKNRRGENNGMYGKKQPTETCIHCGKIASKSNIKRWHNDNCKLNT
ncbi:hypothetical protein VH12019_00160 [Vibrio phage VH1_2019]|uniref:HNH nuclease domain-containing protein n=1 Tax=Vibrio phage VH1_2019 TaxID=2686307 RepID=A0A6B9SWZ2_9CAUD|nr:hypothetical protein VH12019_00160 [Vibrio phage VH1_2019]